MTTFALVHGAWHGAWCWEQLTPLLQHAGHDVVTMDLPSEDGAATFDTYADVVCAALDGRGDDVVLVGHSYGGNTVPLVAARRPLRHLVYLCAMIPDIGRSLFDQLSDDMEMLNPAYEQGLSVPDEQLRQVWTDLDLACALFYGDCGEPVAQGALNRLRPQSAYPAILPFSLAEFPAVKTTYVVCSEDQILRPEWSRRTARDRVGAELIELPGDHSPFYSRPSVLADVLLRLADQD
jgi:pimeloyl-ACP methyl ester carboxylesterase